MERITRQYINFINEFKKDKTDFESESTKDIFDVAPKEIERPPLPQPQGLMSKQGAQ